MLDKKYLRRVALYIFGSLLAIGMTAYIGYHLWQSVTREIETVPAVSQSFSVTAEYDAWVFRDEVLITSEVADSGTVVPSVRDGERVSKSSSVAGVYPTVSHDKITELETVRSQIRLLEGRHTSTVGGDLGIGEVMLSMNSSVKNGELSDSSELASRLVALAAARATGGGNTVAVIETLRAKEAELLASFGGAAGNVYTPYSGWYYNGFDGYESIFTSDVVKGISPSALEELLNTEPVSVNGGAGRVVRTHKWYIAEHMTSSHEASFEEGDTTSITLTGIADPLELTVESVVNGAENKTAVVFSCGIIPEGYDVDRHLTVDFTLKEVTGFGVPKEAVRMQDGVTGVYTYNGVLVKFRKIDIIAEYDDMYIAAVRKNESTVALTEPPAESTDTGDVAETAEPKPQDPVGEGTGRTDFDWLEENEFIVVKGKALYNGRVIG